MMRLKRKINLFSPTPKVPLEAKTSPEAVIILLLLVIAFASCLDMRMFQVYFYQSVGYLLNVFTIAVCFGFYILRHKKYTYKDIKLIAFALFLIGYCVVSALITNGGMRYVGTVFNTVIIVIILRDSNISFRAVRNTCFAIVAIMLCIAMGSGGYYNNQFANDSINSNYIAQLSVAGMVYVNYFLCFINHSKPHRIEAARIIIDAISFYIIWECQSRGSLLAIVSFVGMFYFLPKKLLKKKNFITVMSGVISVFGVLMTYLYLIIVVPTNALLMGKSTLTRNKLWTYFWENVGNNRLKFFIGYGTNDSMRDVFGYGFHNISLGIWYDIGLIGFLLFTCFILWNMREVYKGNRELNMFTIYGMIGFMTFQISDYFAITFTGPLVIWNYIMLGFIAMAQKRGDR